VLETEMQQQQPAPSQEELEGVPPPATTDAREAQQPPVEEQPPPAPTPPAADDDDDAPPADAPLLPLGDDEFPDDIIAVICRFLGLRELGRLACVARRFTEAMLTEPGGAKLLSPIEEGARLRLAAAAAAGGGSGGGGASGGAAAARLADETWLRALWRVQYRLLFTSCGSEVVLSEEGALRLRAAGRAAAATRGLGGARAWAPAPACIHSGAGWLSCVWARGACCACGALRAVAAVTRPCCLSDSLLCLCLCVFMSLLRLPLLRAGTVATSRGRSHSAVCAEHPMVAGAQYVEMTLLKKSSSGAYMGVVGQGFDAAHGRPFLSEAYNSAEGWMLGTGGGYLCHARYGSNWEGKPQQDEIKPGDVAGLLLDLGQRTLSLYLNGAWRGVMVAPGMKDRRGEAVASLAGPLRWAVDVGYGDSVRIERRPAPGPVPSAEEVAAAVAWNEANYSEW
jgi:hypothetical protein